MAGVNHRRLLYGPNELDFIFREWKTTELYKYKSDIIDFEF